jgi:hypothetical protein
MFADAKTALDYLLAGRATVTLRSAKTGIHYTFNVDRAPRSETRWFVSVLVSPEHYEYLGTIDALPQPSFRLTKKSPSVEYTPAKAFSFAFAWLLNGRIPEGLEIRHEGSCGRCGRQLTHPESIDRGFGPECVKIIDRKSRVSVDALAHGRMMSS